MSEIEQAGSAPSETRYAAPPFWRKFLALIAVPQVVVTYLIVDSSMGWSDPDHDPWRVKVFIWELIVNIVLAFPALLAFVLWRILLLHPRARAFRGNAWAIILVFALSCGSLILFFTAEERPDVSAAAWGFVMSIPLSLTYCLIAGARWPISSHFVLDIRARFR